MKFDIKEVLVAGDRVIVRGEVSGTPAGDLFGVPHSGKSFRIMAVDINPLILGPDFGPSVRMLRILGVLFPFAAFFQVVMGYVLVPLRYDRLVTVVSLIWAVATVTLTVGLGWRFAGEGVAWPNIIGGMLTE